MSDDGRDERGEVGSVAEEAAKLLGALNGWAREHAGDAAGATGDAASAASGFLHDLDRHVATGGEDCRYCPVCQLISTVRATSPEVRQHLTTAATSLLHAATGVLEAYGRRAAAGERDTSSRRDPVERIDLGDDGDDTEWED